MLKFIFDRYVAKGGSRTFDEFQNPHTGLVGLAYIDGEPTVLFWSDELVDLCVKKPTVKELKDADSRV
ncbi:hypothetical protein [Agrobacterium tumefaciens]|uniref:hypothetical protein n=1 Tax=Agrobacterium tumefaciens TaxID=358 RepID=UPI0005526879|nr:hypothetical protein [Agrobacterium tumefaciens]